MQIIKLNKMTNRDLMMMSETVTLVKYEESNRKKLDGRPVTIEWNKERMIRNHSIRATVKEILRITESDDVIKINIVGDTGKGKTTLALTLAHLIHKMSDIPFTVRHLTKIELLDFRETIKNLQPTNYVLIFDDVSFLSSLTSRHKIEELKQCFTEVRHLPGGQDIKIVAMFNFHYNFALDKYLRMADFYYWVSVGSSEFENMQKIIGVKNTQKIQNFQKVHQVARLRKKFSFLLGKKNWFHYIYRKPFAPVLFWDGFSARTVVYPKREWIDAICSVCIASKKTPMKDGINVNDFSNDLSYKFGKQLARTAIRMKLFQNGINVFPKTVKQCMQYIDKYLDNRNVNLQEIAEFYNFKNDRTRLDEKIPELV